MTGLLILLSVVAVVVLIEVLIRRTEYYALRQELRSEAQAQAQVWEAAPAVDLSEGEKGRLRHLLGIWARLHHAPHSPVLIFAQPGSLSPAGIRDAVAVEDEDGKLFIAMVASGLKFASLDQILECFVPREIQADSN